LAGNIVRMKKNIDQIKVQLMVSARLPTSTSEFRLCLYQTNQDTKEHLALVKGDVQDKDDVLVRIHSECFTGDLLGSRRCDCGEQLACSLQMIAEMSEGILIYLRQEGRGIGLLEKLRAYNLQDEGYDTVEANLLLGHQADERDYTVAARILGDLGVHSVRLITNNPSKIENLESQNIVISERVPIIPTVNDDNAEYLNTKVQRMNHLLNLTAELYDISGNGKNNP
jgi:GTP cyclohydrolase II